MILRRLCGKGDEVLLKTKGTELEPGDAEFLQGLLAGEKARGNLLVARRPGEKVPHPLDDLANPTEAEEILSVPALVGG